MLRVRPNIAKHANGAKRRQRALHKERQVPDRESKHSEHSCNVVADPPPTSGMCVHIGTYYVEQVPVFNNCLFPHISTHQLSGFAIARQALLLWCHCEVEFRTKNDSGRRCGLAAAKSSGDSRWNAAGDGQYGRYGSEPASRSWVAISRPTFPGRLEFDAYACT